MYKYKFFIAGSTRNKEKILKICDIFDELKISYYCFLKNIESFSQAGLDLKENINEMQGKFESLDLYSDEVRTIFNEELEGEKNSENFLIVLPAGKSAHIESGIAFGLNKKCYAIGEYDVTDSLYLIFDRIFKDENELRRFLTK